MSAKTRFCLEVSGPMACFTRPELKAEWVSYPVITPSAACGIFNSILWKRPIKWRVVQIDVLNPIKWVNLRRNEIKETIRPPKEERRAYPPDPSMGLLIEECRQQRGGLMLRDVKYRIHAEIDYDESKSQGETCGKYVAMFDRRASKGQCFRMPYLGNREFSCEFRLIRESEMANEPPPIQEDLDLQLIFYDFDYDDVKRPPTFYHARMKQGVIKVPHPDSEDVKR